MDKKMIGLLGEIISERSYEEEKKVYKCMDNDSLEGAREAINKAILLRQIADKLTEEYYGSDTSKTSNI